MSIHETNDQMDMTRWLGSGNHKEGYVHIFYNSI